MKVVLAYSGGLDTSVILHWIKERYDAEVVTYSATGVPPAAITRPMGRAASAG